MLNSTDIHPTAETVYKSLAISHPTMSLATVYKTLDSLKKAGLVIELNVGEDSFRYDANCSEHIHLVCDCCKEVFDLHDIKSLEELKKEVGEKSNFKIKREQLVFFGTCQKCSEEK